MHTNSAVWPTPPNLIWSRLDPLKLTRSEREGERRGGGSASQPPKPAARQAIIDQQSQNLPQNHAHTPLQISSAPNFVKSHRKKARRKITAKGNQKGWGPAFFWSQMVWQWNIGQVLIHYLMVIWSYITILISNKVADIVLYHVSFIS